MLVAVLRLTLLVGALCSMAIAAPHGKVVRVERQVASAVLDPSLCQFQAHDGTGLCLGTVKTGDIVVLLSTDAVVGEVRVDEAKPTKPACPLLQNIKGTLMKGTLAGGNNGNVLGIVGGGIDRSHGRMVADPSTTPSPNGRDLVRAAVDRDGDGVADIVMTQSQCDPTSTSSEVCFDMWATANTSRTMRQVQHVNLQNCF
jgi:hypothetical protein